MDISTAFNQAVNRAENIQQNGHVNWNYIDADVFMDCKPADSAAHYKQFNQLADQYELLHGKQIQDNQFGIWSEAALEGLQADFG